MAPGEILGPQLAPFGFRRETEPLSGQGTEELTEKGGLDSRRRGCQRITGNNGEGRGGGSEVVACFCK